MEGHDSPLVMRLNRLFLVATIVSVCAACGSDTDSDSPEGSGSPDAGASADSGSAGESDASAGADTAVEDTAPEAPTPELPNFAGECPSLSGLEVPFAVADLDRAVDIYLPDDPQGAGLVFLYHGAGDSPGNFARAFDADSLASIYNVIVAVPHATGNHFVEWPLISGEDPEKDLSLADAIIACASQEYDIDARRIYTTGFSAGALWSTRMVIERSEYLASAVTFSGGYDSLTFDYETPEFATPVLGTHGGQSDVVLGVNFANATNAFLTDLVADGSFAIICDHGAGHTVPFDPYQWAFPFLFDHSWGEPSPYIESGLDSVWPEFCEIVE